MTRGSMTRGSRLLEIPWHVLAIAAALVVLGLLFVQSSTEGTWLEGSERRQLRIVLALLPVLVGTALLPPRRLARLSFPLFFAGLASLVTVLFFGFRVANARRWFGDPDGLRVQPSEFLKPLLVLALARWLEFRRAPERLRDLVVPALLTLAPMALVALEPDLGTALLFLPILAATVYVAGARRLHFALALAGAAVLAPTLYFSPLLHEYQKERVRSFLTTSVPRLKEQEVEARRHGEEAVALALERERKDLMRGSGYQAFCAQTSIGSGGAWGKGLGQGPQNRRSYLPARHTDFVFAVVAEEWGFAGSALVIGLFLLLALALLALGASTRDRFSQLCCVGAAASLLPQALANLAMASGLIPVTGIPLPFMSQGGSSLLSSLLLLGIVLSAARSRRRAEPFLYPIVEAKDPFFARAAEPVRERV